MTREQAVYKIGPVIVDEDKGRISYGANSARVPPRCLAMLRALNEQRDKFFSEESLRKRIPRRKGDGASLRSIKSLLNNALRRLKLPDSLPYIIDGSSRSGYRLALTSPQIANIEVLEAPTRVVTPTSPPDKFSFLIDGMIPIWAPIGYLDCGGGKVKVPDPKMAGFVREAFELYATGNYSLPRLVEEMYARGLRNRRGSKVSLNGMSTMLNNPFYVGLIRMRKSGECFSGLHAPVVSKGTFDTVQQILDGRTVVRTHRHEFAFSRMIRCTLCGRTTMAEIQKGNTYYRCHTRDCETKTIREDRLENELTKAFVPLRLNDEEMTYIREWFAWARAHKHERAKSEREACALQVAQIRERVSRLTDAYLDGSIEKELLNERRGTLLLEEAGVKQRIQDLEAGNDAALARLENYLELIQTASNLHKMTLPYEKRTLVKKLTSNFALGPENAVITLTNAAQVIANRSLVLSGSSSGNRTRICAVKGRRPNH